MTILVFNDNDITLRGFRDRTAIIDDATITCSIGSRANGETGGISGATNAEPIVITTTAAHLLTTGDQVVIYGVLGNVAANGTWTVTVTGATTFSLDDSIGDGAYVSGGTWHKVVTGGASIEMPFVTGSQGDYRGTYAAAEIAAGLNVVLVCRASNYALEIIDNDNTAIRRRTVRL